MGYRDLANGLPAAVEGRVFRDLLRIPYDHFFDDTYQAIAAKAVAMSDRTLGLLYVAVMLLLSLAFQYQMKVLAGEVAPILSRGTDLADKVLAILHGSIVWRLAATIALATVLFCVWLLVLTKLELSLALPLASLALVVNAIGAGLLLGEELGLLRIGGVLAVAVGIAMVLKS